MEADDKGLVDLTEADEAWGGVKNDDVGEEFLIPRNWGPVPVMFRQGGSPIGGAKEQ